MDRSARVGLYLSLPVGFFLALASGLAMLAGIWTERPYVSALTPLLYQGAGISLLVATVWGVVQFVRFYRWTKGNGLLCRCGGLLGREHDGRYGPYRKCLGCGRNVSQREYQSM